MTYSNPATQVTATFTPGPTGWEVQVPLPAPIYVAREILAAAREAGFTPSDPQTGWAPRWDAANSAAAAQLAAGGTPPVYCPRSKAEYWWSYTRARQDIRRTWPSDDIGLAEVWLWARRPAGEAVLVAVAVEEWHSAVWPLADFVVIRRTRISLPGVAGAPAAKNLLPLREAESVLGEAIRRYDEPVPHLLYRGGEAHPFLMRSLRHLPGVPPAEFAPIRPGHLVDVT